MWLVTLRDLQFRKRRFAITIAGTAIVFTLALALSGVSNGFKVEVKNTVGGVGADAWVVREGVSGPFTSTTALAASETTRVAAAEGVQEAWPLVTGRRDFPHHGQDLAVYIIGYVPGQLGAPPLAEGQGVIGVGQVVADRRLEFAMGETFNIGDQEFRVVGLTEGQAVFAGVPNLYMSIGDARVLAFGGRPVVTSIVTKGIPEDPPAGLAVLSNEVAREDLQRPVENGIKTINQVLALLWIVSILIIGAVMYLSALERTRDFAVLKAVGATTRNLFIGLAVQAVVVTLLSSAIAEGLAPLMAPLFPLQVVIPVGAFLQLPAVAILAALAASLVGIRRVASVDPALAFGEP